MSIALARNLEAGCQMRRYLHRGVVLGVKFGDDLLLDGDKGAEKVFHSSIRRLNSPFLNIVSAILTVPQMAVANQRHLQFVRFPPPLGLQSQASKLRR